MAHEQRVAIVSLPLQYIFSACALMIWAMIRLTSLQPLHCARLAATGDGAARAISKRSIAHLLHQQHAQSSSWNGNNNKRAGKKQLGNKNQQQQQQ